MPKSAVGLPLPRTGSRPARRRYFDKIIVTALAALFLMGCQAQIDPRDAQPDRPPPDLNSPLIGTTWEGRGRGGGGLVILYFESAERVIFNPELPGERFLDYHFSQATRRGNVATLGNFSVTEEYKAIEFYMNWRHYPCGADFARVMVD